jgi:SAM-dependent methyltransferase
MWKIKVLIQFILSKLPMGEKINYLLQKINKSHSLQKTQERVIRLSKDFKTINDHIRLEDSTVVEIGTGWDAINPILLYFMGVKRCHTYDHLPHVRFELVKVVIDAVKNNLDKVSEMTGVPVSILRERLSRIVMSDSLDELFMKANISYHAPGDATKTELENNSVDLVYSYAVLEHVPVNGLHDLTVESKRILKNSGLNYHVIGLHDHYSGFDKKITKVNFLKYPEWLWAFWVYNKISYHNRLREKEFIELWRSYGAKIIWSDNKTDPNDIEKLKNMKIDKRFEGMSLQELAIYVTKVIFSFSAKTP